MRLWAALKGRVAMEAIGCDPVPLVLCRGRVAGPDLGFQGLRGCSGQMGVGLTKEPGLCAPKGPGGAGCQGRADVGSPGLPGAGQPCLPPGPLDPPSSWALPLPRPPSISFQSVASRPSWPFQALAHFYLSLFIYFEREGERTRTSWGRAERRRIPSRLHTIIAE